MKIKTKFFNKTNIILMVIIYLLLVLIIANINPKITFLAILTAVYGSLIFVGYQIQKHLKKYK